MNISHDHQFEEVRLTKVARQGDSFSVERDDGWSFGFADPGFEPQAGDVARFYGEGIGRPVRGLTLNGRVVFYRTPAEEAQRHREWVADLRRTREREFEENRAKRDAQYDALPAEFRARIDRFRAGNPDFRVEHEPYELFCCEEAVKIAAAFTGNLDGLRAFGALDWSEQITRVPTLSDGHSGNTFGMACRLAYWYLTQPQIVAKEHGALAPLVGCDAYGCTHDTDPQPDPASPGAPRTAPPKERDEW